MDCCNGWTTENIHSGDCPVFNRWMDETNTFETYLRNTAHYDEVVR